VAKATTSVDVAGSSFRSGTHPTVKVRVTKLSNGSWPTGTVEIRVGGDTVKSVRLKADDHGRVDVTLPRTYTKDVTVRAVFTPSSEYVEKATSPSVRITVRR
jgi:hypothetical protein